FDVQVSALPQSHTASLAGGRLYQTDLAINGANELSPGNPVAVMARTQGEVFVNPAYAMLSKNELMPTARASLRYGMILGGGQAMQDRPLRLRLRSTQASMARHIENRIDTHFQDRTVAAAQDEAFVK